MPTGIVYYSWFGNTRFVARELASRIGAEAVELLEKRRRRIPFGFLSGVVQAVRGRPSRLTGDPWLQSRTFDPIYLVTPVWASNPTPAMNAFLAQASLEGRTVHLVTAHADPNFEGQERVLTRLRAAVRSAGGTVGRELAFHTANPREFAGEEALRAEAERLAAAT